MQRSAMPVRLILSVILIYTLLIVSLQIVGAFATLGDTGEFPPLACEGCSEPYNAWIRAENSFWDSTDDDASDTLITAMILAKSRYEDCVATGGCNKANAHFNYVPIVGLTISFNASSSTGNIKNYSWSFGEYELAVSEGKLMYHASGASSTVQHTYDKPGSYGVILTVNAGEATESQYRVQISVGQDSLQIASITPPEQLVFGRESQWGLQFEGTCGTNDPAAMRFDVYDQNETHLGGYGLYDLYLSGTTSGYSFDKSTSADIPIPSGTTELTFKAYLHTSEPDRPTASTEEVYRFEILEIVNFSCDAPSPGKLGEFYTVTAEIVDKEENGPWIYMFRTATGEFLDTGNWLHGSHPSRARIERDHLSYAEITWRTPTIESTTELEYAKNMIQVTKDLARNMAATGSSTIPFVGRVLKGANDMYNLYNDIGTMSGYAGKSWQAMTRGELLRAVMHASNAAVEGFQVTVGGVLLLPKAVAPTGLKEVANVCTDVVNAGIDYAQVSWETLTEALVEEAKASRVIWASVLVKVTNNTGDHRGKNMFVELRY